MALTLRKPTRPVALSGRPRPAYAHGGAVAHHRAMSPAEEVRHGHRQHPIPPQAGGPVGIAPPNPTGKPPHELAQISAQVRAGVRPPSWPSHQSERVQETPARVQRALELARAVSADGGGDRLQFATGGTVDEGSASWLNPVGNQMAQQMLASGMPQFAAYQQTGWKPVNGQLQYDPQVQQQPTAAAQRPQFAQGGSIHPHVMRALAMAEDARRAHLATGGQILQRIYAGRPRFDDGGGAGGDGGGGSSGSGSDGGAGGPGGDGSSGMGGDGSGSTGNGQSGGLGGTSNGDGSTTGMGGVGGAVGGDTGMSGIGAANAAGSDASTSPGYGGFGFGGIDGPGSPAANAAGSIGAAPAGFSSPGISGVTGGITGNVDANNASNSTNATGLNASMTGAPAGVSVSGPVGGIDGSAPAPSFGSFSGTQAGMAAANAGLSGFGQGFGANGLGSSVGSLGGTSDNTFGANGIAGTSMTGDMSAAPTSNPFGSLGTSPSMASQLGGLSGAAAAFGAFGGNEPGTGFDAGQAPAAGLGFSTPTGLGNLAAGAFSGTNASGDLSGQNLGSLSASVAAANNGFGPNPAETNVTSDPSMVGDTPALTVHAPPSFAAGNVTGDTPVGAFASSPAVTDYANATQMQQQALPAGLNLSTLGAGAFTAAMGSNESAFSGAQAGQPGMDAAAVNPVSHALGIAQDLDPGRTAQMVGTVENAAGMPQGSISGLAAAVRAGTMSPQAFGYAVGNAPASLAAQMQNAASEVANNPQYSALKNALQDNATMVSNPQQAAMNIAKAFTAYEGAFTPGEPGYAGYVSKAANAIQAAWGNIGAVNASTPGSPTQTANVTGATPAPSTTPTAAPAPTKTALGPDDPNPADPTHTMDGTPLSTPDTATTTAPAAPNSWTSQPVPTDTTPGPATVATGLPAAPSLPADESDPSTLSQIGSFVSGLLGSSPLGSALSGIGSAIGGIHSGAPGGVGGSGNGNSGQTSSGTAGAIPINPNATAPASAGPAPQGSASAAAQARIAAILASIQGGAPASSGTYHPTYLATQPPTTAGATPYNPLADPYVLRALGLAGS